MLGRQCVEVQRRCGLALRPAPTRKNLGMMNRNDLRTVLIEAFTGAAEALSAARAADLPSPQQSAPAIDLDPAAVTIHGKVAVNVPEAAEILGIGRTMTLKLMDDGELRSLKVGRRVLIPVEAILDFVRQTPGGAASAT